MPKDILLRKGFFKSGTLSMTHSGIQTQEEKASDLERVGVGRSGETFTL